MTSIDAQYYINLDSYPINRPGSHQYREVCGVVKAALEDKGCAILKSFIRAQRLRALVEEAKIVAPWAHRSFCRTNVYFTRDDPSFPSHHPIRRFYDRSNAFVAADNFKHDSILRAIYEWPAFSPFIQAVLGEDQFFRYADPLADVIINVVEPGGGFPWHFDTNNFTVTLAIQNSEQGGLFEYCPHLRSTESENYEGVQAILDGDSAATESLALESGDLQIFKGRYSLHRVTGVEGRRSRYVAIFSYAEEPGMVASPERCKQLYGRVLPIHYEHAGQRSDRLID